MSMTDHLALNQSDSGNKYLLIQVCGIAKFYNENFYLSYPVALY